MNTILNTIKKITGYSYVVVQHADGVLTLESTTIREAPSHGSLWMAQDIVTTYPKVQRAVISLEDNRYLCDIVGVVASLLRDNNKDAYYDLISLMQGEQDSSFDEDSCVLGK